MRRDRQQLRIDDDVASGIGRRVAVGLHVPRERVHFETERRVGAIGEFDRLRAIVRRERDDDGADHDIGRSCAFARPDEAGECDERGDLTD